jgi:hypothetical protein
MSYREYFDTTPEEEDNTKTRVAATFADLSFLGMGMGTVQFASGLLLFYIALSGNFLGELFSRQMQEVLTNNRWVKHIVAFVTMMFTITYVSGVTKLLPAIFITVVLYLWFLMTTKMPLAWNFGIIIALVVGFILNKYRDALDQDKHQDRITLVGRISNVLFIVTIVATLIGAIWYMFDKRSKFGSDFSFIKFLFAPAGGKMTEA